MGTIQVQTAFANAVTAAACTRIIDRFDIFCITVALSNARLSYYCSTDFVRHVQYARLTLTATLTHPEDVSNTPEVVWDQRILLSRLSTDLFDLRTFNYQRPELMVITPTETNMKPKVRADCSSVVLQTFYSVLTGAHKISSRLTFSGLASRYHPVILA